MLCVGVVSGVVVVTPDHVHDLASRWTPHKLYVGHTARVAALVRVYQPEPTTATIYLLSSLVRIESKF